MKTLLTYVLLLLFYIVEGQTQQQHMVVYLKDGSNIKGTVTINDADGTVMVIDKEHETHYYQKNMVAKIDEIAQHSRSYDLKSRGYVCNIELGGTDVLAKDGGGAIPAFAFDIVNSYVFSPYASVGIGVGTELCSGGYNLEMFSIYADARIYFMRSNISPFLNLDFGYNGMFIKYSYYANSYYQSVYGKEGDHGFEFNPSIGVRVGVSKKVAMTAGVGYKLYYLKSEGRFYDLSRNNTFRHQGDGFYLFNALSIKAGFQF